MLQKLNFPDAELLLRGAQLTRFKDWLFFPSNPNFEDGKSFHGGIPVIFPWFGPNKNEPNEPQHGWARTELWGVESSSENHVTLHLEHTGWNIHVRYDFGDELKVSFSVQNGEAQTRTFEVALHTYFALSDIASIEVEGLDALTFMDKTEDYARKTQSGPVQFQGEVDRIYLNAPSPLHIKDGVSGFELRGDWKSAVTWNPGQEKAATMSDLGRNDWRHFVCVEVGAVADDAIELAAGQTWTMNLEVVV